MKYKIKNFIENWIYPGYYLKNYFYYRFDLVRLPQIKKYQYEEIDKRILYANMQLLIEFIESNPKQSVDWYTDDKKYKNKYVIDIMTELYNWWKIEYQQEWKEYYNVLSIWSKYFQRNSINSINDFKKKNIDWKLFNKYFDINKILETNYVFNIVEQLEQTLNQKIQNNLHLLIEMRPYMWT